MKKNKSTVVFIACSKTKKGYRCPAKELYQGQLFKKAFAFSSRHFSHIYILSAKYGILHPDQVIEPYEKTLLSMKPSEVKAWYQMVEKQMENLKLNAFKHVFFASRLYCKEFEGEKPLYGLKYGECLKWFKKREQKRNRLL